MLHVLYSQNGGGVCSDKVQVQPAVKVGENHCLGPCWSWLLGERPGMKVTPWLQPPKYHILLLPWGQQIKLDNPHTIKRLCNLID